ncbi:hypothetical protein PICSAR14_03200 [Mycobacterium avium subsp. paratuberculosis]|nr:hypothetical protein PICSAR14_03200 [Mycobacterium avium subsp. paratuberculosis]
MRPLLGHAPVRRQRLQPQVVDAQVQPPGQLDRAHHGVDGKFDAGEFGLGGEEGVVEGHVVGDQGAAAQHLDHVARDVGELRLVFQHGGGQAVHVGGARIHARVEQAHHRLLDLAAGVQPEHRKADDASLTRAKARGLDVDDGPSRVRLAGRTTPAHRAHALRMARATDITGVPRRRVGVRIDPGDPLRPATSAALAIARNPMRATRCARRQAPRLRSHRTR